MVAPSTGVRFLLELISYSEEEDTSDRTESLFVKTSSLPVLPITLPMPTPIAETKLAELMLAVSGPPLLVTIDARKSRAGARHFES